MNQSLSSDQFLYFCRQALVARTIKSSSKYGLKPEAKTEFDSHLRYEPFLYKTYKAPKALTVSAFRRELGLICQHAFEVSPQFRRSEQIDLETISFFSAAIATLVADIESLFFEYTSLPLPAILGVPVPRSDAEKLPQLSKLFMKYEVYLKSNQGLPAEAERPEFVAYPLEASKAARRIGEAEEDPGDNANLAGASQETEAELVFKDKVLISEEFWGSTFNTIRKIFRDHHQSILSFLNWHFQPEIEPEKIDWRLRPPVGEAFQQFVRGLQSQSRAGAQYSFGSGGSSSGASFGSQPGQKYGQKSPFQGKPDRPPKRKDADESQEKKKSHFSEPESGHMEKREQKQSNDKSTNKQIDERSVRKADQTPKGKYRQEHDSDLERPADRTRHSGPRPSQETEPAELDAALQEVEHCVRILQKNSRRPGLKLKPQNSFIRRHQHMRAKELDYETESVGEGKDRCVYLKNKAFAD